MCVYIYTSELETITNYQLTCLWLTQNDKQTEIVVKSEKALHTVLYLHGVELEMICLNSLLKSDFK